MTSGNSVLADILEFQSRPRPASSYCSFIAHVTHRALKAAIGKEPDIVREVTAPIQRDGTYCFNTTKTLEVTDFNGTRYLITIEDMRDVKRDTEGNLSC